MSTVGAPPFTPLIRGAWTGSELAVLEPDPNQGPPLSLNAYDPILDSWRNIPIPSNVAFTPRTGPYLGAVSGKLIIYGGSADPWPGTGYLTDGWVVDLNALSWTPMTPGPMLWNADDYFPRVFADGSRAVFVPVGDYTDVKDVAVAAYDLSTQTWETVSGPSSTNGFGCIAPAWNGAQALCQSSVFLSTVTSSPLAIKPFPSLFVTGGGSALFSPVGDMFLGLTLGTMAGNLELSWIDATRQIWSAAAPVTPLGTMAATVNGQALFWGMGPAITTAAGAVNIPFVAEAFDPGSGVWSPVTCAGAPTYPVGGLSVATPSGLIVFQGSDSATGNAVLEL